MRAPDRHRVPILIGMGSSSFPPVRRIMAVRVSPEPRDLPDASQALRCLVRGCSWAKLNKVFVCLKRVVVPRIASCGAQVGQRRTGDTRANGPLSTP